MTRTRWTSGFLRLSEKIKMCIFWFEIVAKLDDQDDMDEWFYQAFWKRSTSVFISIIKKKLDILFLYSCQVGRPGRRGQVVFSPSLKNHMYMFEFWFKIVAKLDDQDDVDEWISQS